MPEPGFGVADYLDAPLGVIRVRELERLADQVAIAPLAGTVTDLRAVLGAGIGMEDYWRLHILISHLHHQSGADLGLTRELRAEVGQALTRRGTTPPSMREEG